MIASAGEYRVVGCWHTHPSGLELASGMDLQALEGIHAQAAPKYPLLLIGSLHPHSSDWQFRAYHIVNDNAVPADFDAYQDSATEFN
jgi:proteasome lid subunit RPN8/RPN11